jgi:hypothetical protein
MAFGSSEVKGSRGEVCIGIKKGREEWEQGRPLSLPITEWTAVGWIEGLEGNIGVVVGVVGEGTDAVRLEESSHFHFETARGNREEWWAEVHNWTGEMRREESH